MYDASEWRRDGNTLRRSVVAPDFRTAIAIVNEIAEQAEALNHHPDIDIRWRTLHFALTTHDAGALTDLDYTLAARIDGILAAHGVANAS
ncbi:4a-hydroxytetrahydrobiopterin dehydratase [Thermobispora bispora]|jgi:4a-hydroxytetrahydrobiopterin dehydratase|uniref:Putative pterin-4-alpha-carbinolamine dehydratase n=1 Tax=Thermobispora bispora (strain ATCC 19993 / DSM 43833 / CBS 139.67 / JCM 10125 / KCTC 9307 / NBRC 14880 / R51) TaxID=469371 RepID=D6Y5J0_THEBD|nr:4a-hydroxytetrahydrobiopterin dehydratase [Thermobispora bispora]MBO2473541.1 4a-hydroxytetrahydrobiopterin dehydratase [Actinomycetales bacterium]MDI9582433.1 4a-hydroxytetrahydrobiopterin dehydratase [Thermobispora sp.]ADG89385.1 transcriptional coactivator/pterin dehydratase [Thermobispora bispora DSM 43833]MBX6168134.1 4a-hydroxytetrahydrobiopterin dehydratase [Thermobispora bispora]QSI49038.1 4a-hydroxytetrahydrobiopterin dehydratase [Thermobispora bispora]